MEEGILAAGLLSVTAKVELDFPPQDSELHHLNSLKYFH
jgi:hypothetical protein